MSIYYGLIAAVTISLLTATASALPEHRPLQEHKKTRIIATQSESPANITIKDAWSRPTTGSTGAAFMEIKNSSQKDISIISASADIAETTEIHGHSMDENGVMKMFKLEKLEIKAKDTAILEPGGNHIMFFGLKNPLKNGDKFKLTLSLANGRHIDTEITVESDE